MSPAENVTLKDIAEKAGVSVMTVSRVLRNAGACSEETRQRVEKVAQELGYRPNPLVSALMSYRSRGLRAKSYSTLAFVTSFPSKNGWRETKIYNEFFEGASRSADRHGFRLEEFWLREPGMTAERLSRILYHRNVPGMLIAPLPVAHGHLRLDWEKFSAVTFGYSLARPSLHRAVNHQFRSMRIALRQLRKLGYRRMGLAMAAGFDRRVDHQWSGSFLAEQGRGDGERLPLFLTDENEWNERRFAQWFCEHKPEVILGHSTEVVDWLKAMGRRVPDDVGFVHLNCPTSGEFAGVYQNGIVIGEVAADFLVSMIQRSERGVPKLAHSIVVDGTWIDGSTVRKLR